MFASLGWRTTWMIPLACHLQGCSSWYSVRWWPSDHESLRLLIGLQVWDEYWLMIWGVGRGGAFSLTLTQLADVAYDFVGERGGEWGKQVGSMNKKSQVRSCCNITYLHQPENSVCAGKDTCKQNINKTFRTWKQKSRLNNSNYVINTVTI